MFYDQSSKISTDAINLFSATVYYLLKLVNNS